MTRKRGIKKTLRLDRAAWLRYGVAALVVVGAFAGLWTFPQLSQAVGTDQLVLSLAVLVAAWFGGLGPGFFATALVLVVTWPPTLSASTIIRLVVFVTECSLASLLMGSLNRARDRALREAAQRRLGEAALRKAEAFKSAILESAFDCILTIDHEGRIIEFNPAAERTFGYRRAEVAGRQLSDLIVLPRHEGGRGDAIAADPGVALDPILRRRVELTSLRSDGSEFPIELAVAPSGMDGDRYFTAYLRDITARKRLEDELRQQAGELQEAARRKDEFLAMLAHELRNPLAAIHSAAAVAAQTTRREELDWSRDAINRNVKHLARLIDDLLDVSRVTHGKIKLRKERCDAASVIDQAIESIQPLVATSHHELKVAVARGSLWLDADPTRLVQILSNLLINSVQYSENGSHIWLNAERQEKEIVITVRDTGQGISPKLLPRVFDLFTQGDRSLARTEGGLGIGLTMVKTMTEMHGGTVAAASAGPGNGSEFMVRLPAAESPMPPVPPIQCPAANGRGRGNRVLVVDDNVDLARALASLLSGVGYEVKAVYDGFAAIEAARAHQPTVVLVDIGLPGMDGYEVARRLRVEEGFRDATIIAITGYGQDDDYRQPCVEGFDHHLIKPVQIKTLVSLLAKPGIR